jgi:excisionase family DNA binding protein
MNPIQAPEMANQVIQILDVLSESIARKIAKQLAPEIKKLYEADLASEPFHRADIRSDPTPAHGSLWPIGKLAADSGIQKGTWYKWIAQRRIPAVRLGRTLRIRDEDYQKLIKKSLRPEINLHNRWSK